MTHAGRCSVVVPTYNRGSSLRRLLHALAEQDIGAAGFNVVVVDDASTDETPRLLAETHTPYQLRSARAAKNAGPAAARNQALSLADAAIIVFLDDDVVPDPTLLRRHVDAHAAGENIAVIGTMEASGRAREPWVAWELRTLERCYDDMRCGRYTPTPRQFFTANASVRRDHLFAAGLFNESFRRSEDVELAYRLQDLGARFRFLPELRVWHEPVRSLSAWLHMAREYGRYDVVMWRDLNREHIMRVMSIEFQRRRRSLRAAARLLVGRDTLAAACVQFSARLLAMYRRPSSPAAMAACSAAFNLEYWRGVCQEIGGRAAFWREIDHPQPEPAGRGAFVEASTE